MPAATLSIREALPADAAALAELKLATFRETFLDGFGVPYPPQDLAIFEADTYGLARVSAELADPAHRSWVVEEAEGARLLAYAHVGPCKLPHPDLVAGEMELYQFYLRGEVQGAGLGKALLEQALGFMAQPNGERGGGRIWIGVWSGNERALALYRARGFEIVGEYQFAVGAWLDDELILRRDPA
jgi:ribosomal protein S18 acetylase RimI-like enzyme